MGDWIPPLSCDTFVALPPETGKHGHGGVIFGKNSDRPPMEVQEVIYCSAQDHASGSKLQCTYIEVSQIPHTYAVTLSKPAWMWGAEMGANEKGVVIGNEAVWTKLCDPVKDLEEKLLGMDLVRLGLERGGTAKECLDVITHLLGQYGQGGPCFEEESRRGLSYHNSFLIADASEAWILETAGHLWAAEHITSGVRNISNLLTIHTKIDASHPDLRHYAQQAGMWKSGDGEFDFAKVFHSDNRPFPLEERETGHFRFTSGKNLMEKFAANNKFTVGNMMSVLRDKEGNICRDGSVSQTVGSQVSLLYPKENKSPNVHWFTGTPDPSISVFKPTIFSDTIDIGTSTKSPDYGDKDPRISKFHSKVDREHDLYLAHQMALKDNQDKTIVEKLRVIEKQHLHDVLGSLVNLSAVKLNEIADMFKSLVNIELQHYKDIGSSDNRA
ncbi:unnamed protein product [Owenia fusiformis]|uniref:Uncharacterized protein n=1 Tax=Owenia fusiformis TaxID=6347 RepID=A0A8J1TT74_OWEFU|nr:unnamed protein product [Owenia fusiformis]